MSPLLLFCLTSALVIGLLIAFIQPHLSFLSETDIPANTTTQTQTLLPLTTLYTTQTVNVRSCASSDCKVVGTYPPDTSIDITNPANGKITDISQLPQWVVFSYTDSNGTNVEGYISNTLLSEHKILQAPTAPTTQSISGNSQSKKSLQSVIAEWSPSVALIACSFSNGDIDFGSGFLTRYNGSIAVVTNKHVVVDENTGYGPSQCSVEIPGDGKNYYSEDINEIKISSDGFDWGYISVPDGDTYFNSIADKKLSLCQEQAQTGDSVAVLGYPDYAGQFSDPTVTQGIISGYAEPYYTTSAQIESGNSGGVALNTDKDCYIGIPSAVQTGNYANLGRILDADIPFSLSY